jgi:hypothetical protein
MTIEEKIQHFIKHNRKICWEAEMEDGEFCVGENKLLNFVRESMLNEHPTKLQDIETHMISVKDRLPKVGDLTAIRKIDSQDRVLKKNMGALAKIIVFFFSFKLPMNLLRSTAIAHNV